MGIHRACLLIEWMEGIRRSDEMIGLVTSAGSHPGHRTPSGRRIAPGGLESLGVIDEGVEVDDRRASPRSVPSVKRIVSLAEIIPEGAQDRDVGSPGPRHGAAAGVH